MSKLFSSIKIGNLSVKNRIVMPPMCLFTAGEDGLVTDFHVAHYASRAVGGTGLIIVEVTAIEEYGRLANTDIGIWSDKHIEGLKRIVDQIKEHDAVAGIQLGHAGRKSKYDKIDEIFAPSAIVFDGTYRVPTEMTKSDIERVVKAFRDSARRAKEAGFDMIEVHAAHGYLLSEFLSPLSNKRTDEYGGSHENRVRILGEVLDAVKEVFDGTIAIRVSACDYTEGGNDVEDLITMINLVKNKGIELVDVSSGAIVDAKINLYPGYQIKYAERIKEACELPVIGGGLLTSAQHMEEIVSNNRADMVFVGRELLRNPYFPLNAAHELKHDIEWHKSYKAAMFK